MLSRCCNRLDSKLKNINDVSIATNSFWLQSMFLKPQTLQENTEIVCTCGLRGWRQRGGEGREGWSKEGEKGGREDCRDRESEL